MFFTSVMECSRTIQVGAKVSRQVTYAAGTPFWKACRRALTRPEFNRLMDDGFCWHKFPNGQDLLFTFRAQDDGLLVQSNLDVIDPRIKKVVARLDFRVFLEQQRASMDTMVLLPLTGFSAQAQDVLLQAGFTFAEIIPLVFADSRCISKDNEAFCIREEYRAKSTPGFVGLSHVLVSTAVRIVKGLGVDRIDSEQVGNPSIPGSRAKLISYYIREFGAEVVDAARGDMVIRI